MSANTWVKANIFDNNLRIKIFDFIVGIQLIEVAYAKCQIGVGKSFTASASFMPMKKVGTSCLIAASLSV